MFIVVTQTNASSAKHAGLSRRAETLGFDGAEIVTFDLRIKRSNCTQAAEPGGVEVSFFSISLSVCRSATVSFCPLSPMIVTDRPASVFF